MANDDLRLVILNAEEVNDLIDSILEGVVFVEEGGELRETWPSEMRDWCEMLIDRLVGPE